MEEQLSVAVTERSAVGHVRRLGAELARQAGFSERDLGRVALVATELAGNASLHGRDAEAVWRQTERPDGARGLELLVLDRGPGIADIAASLRDGYSTTGTPGTGLGAVTRVADRFDIHSVPAVGTAIVAEFWPGGGRRLAPAQPEELEGGAVFDGGVVDHEPVDTGRPLEVGGISVPKPGETANGDAWAATTSGQVTSILVVDGLGHGVEAARAARAAIHAFESAHPGDGHAVGSLEAIHRSLGETRGAAGAVARVDVAAGVVTYAGVGNIAGFIVADDTTRNMVSMNGILGHQSPRIVEFTYPWSPESLLVMHTDGCRSHWQLSQYPGLVRRHPSLIAAVLYRDGRRGTDDATVVVARAARDAR